MPLVPQRWASKASGLTIADIERDVKALEGTAYPSANPDPVQAKTPFVMVGPGHRGTARQVPNSP